MFSKNYLQQYQQQLNQSQQYQQQQMLQYKQQQMLRMQQQMLRMQQYKQQQMLQQSPPKRQYNAVRRPIGKGSRGPYNKKKSLSDLKPEVKKEKINKHSKPKDNYQRPNRPTTEEVIKMVNIFYSDPLNDPRKTN